MTADEKAFHRAIRANPRDAVARGAFADFLDELGRSTEATAHREWERHLSTVREIVAGLLFPDFYEDYRNPPSFNAADPAHIARVDQFVARLSRAFDESGDAWSIGVGRDESAADELRADPKLAAKFWAAFEIATGIVGAASSEAVKNGYYSCAC